jgi:hypothetical protein
VLHRLFRSSIGSQEIGEIVLESGLTVAVALSLAQDEGVTRELDSAIPVSHVGVDER